MAAAEAKRSSVSGESPADEELPDPTAAKLELGPHPKNVFVTQLTQRDDELDQQLQREVPVVAESGAKLLETGVNTLQQTLVLKKESELSKIDVELAHMRKMFRDRMQSCDSKKIVLAEKQQAMRERVTKFEKFIQENEAKRRRAIQRYQTECRLRALKEKEEQDLRSYLELLRKKQTILSRRVAAYRKFETYLLGVLDILPPDYIKVSDNQIGGMMLRYNTLEHTFQRLQHEMNSVQERIVSLREQESRMKSDHARQLLAKNSQLSALHEAAEQHKGSQDKHEQQVMFVLQQLRDKSETYGMILRAIDNVAMKCQTRYDQPLSELAITDKLQRIKAHLTDTNQIVQNVLMQVREGASYAANNNDDNDADADK